MPDKIQSNRIVCEGGLYSSQNWLDLSTNKPGCATRLVNYEVSLTGGYRRLNGYEAFDVDFAEVGVGVAEGKILGIIIFETSANGVKYIAARKDLGVNTYKFYLYETGTGWAPIVTGLTHNYTNGSASVDRVRWDVGNDGTTNYLCIADGINNAVLYDGTSWAYINSTDTGADFAHAGGNQALDAPAVVTFFQGSLFLGSDVINNTEGVLSYSAPNQFYDFTAASGGGQLVAGFNIIAAKPFRDQLFIFGLNTIKAAYPDVTAGFLVKDVTRNIGCLSRDGVIEIGGDLLFLAPDGFRPIAGTDKIGDVQLETVSKQIHYLIKTRVAGNVGFDVCSVVIRGKSQFRIFFGGDSYEADSSKGIIGCLRTADQQTGWEFGELLGFRASCAASRYVNGEEKILHGDYDGCVYIQETGTSLNGRDMVSYYSTPYLDFGDTETRKEIEKINLFLNGEGSLGITMSVQYDWGRPEIVNPAGYTIAIDGTIPVYDDADYVYDGASSIYGGQLIPISNTNVQGSFYSMRMTFATSGTEAPHSIYGIVVEYKVEGRR